MESTAFYLSFMTSKYVSPEELKFSNVLTVLKRFMMDIMM